MDEPDLAAQGDTMDDLRAVRRMLAKPPPAPELMEAAWARLPRVTQSGPAGAVRPRRRPWAPVRPASRWRRWPRWAVPLSAAVAIAVVAGGSVAVSHAFGHPPAGPATSPEPAVFRQIPRFFLTWPGDNPGPVQVRATATGKVLGTVPVPKPAKTISQIASAGNGRTFILAASRGPLINKIPSEGPTRFYRLVLSPSGRPGRLTLLPIPTETQQIRGLALSPDGSRLAVALAPQILSTGATRIRIFSLATGAEHEWVWPGTGEIGWLAGYISQEGTAWSLSWTADSRTLLFVTDADIRHREIKQVRLLNTADAGSNLRTASTRVPIPDNELSANNVHHPFLLSQAPFITGDGRTVVAPATRSLPRPHPAQHRGRPAPYLEDMIYKFSVQTGKIVRTLHDRKLVYDNGSQILWMNPSGTVFITSEPTESYHPPRSGSVIGILTPTSFTPLPAAIQKVVRTQGLAW